MAKFFMAKFSRPRAGALALLFLAAGGIAPAAAHATIVRTSPAQGGSAQGTVGKVEVWYNEGIGKDLIALAVIDTGGTRVDKRDAAIDSADPSHVTASVGALAPGEYTVRYRAVSADGHIVSGAWNFVVVQGP